MRRLVIRICGQTHAAGVDEQHAVQCDAAWDMSVRASNDGGVRALQAGADVVFFCQLRCAVGNIFQEIDRIAVRRAVAKQNIFFYDNSLRQAL